MKKLFSLVLIAISFIIFGVNSAKAQVKDYSLERYDVNITVNQDSTVDIQELITYKFTGEFSILERGITLKDYLDEGLCSTSDLYQCGGFDFLQITKVKFNEQEVPLDNLNLFITDDGYKKTQNIEYNFGKTQFNGENVVWEIDYKVYGSIGYFTEENYDLFYWNSLPEDRTKNILKSKVEVSFPFNVEDKIFDDDIKVLGDFGTYDYLISGNKVVISPQSFVPTFSDFTVLIKFPHGLINEPGKIVLNLDPTVQTVKFKGLEIEYSNGDIIGGLPEGTYEMIFSRKTYEDKKMQVDVKSAEVVDLTVKLKRKPIFEIINIILLCVFCLTAVISFLSIFYPIYVWYKKGRDKGGRKIVPVWFKPPENIKPYLLGALKDEKVDLKDITSVLIDVARRGFIKIKQENKREYRFIKLKDFNELDPIENFILSKVFGSKDEVTTSDLKYKFYLNLSEIKRKIYEELVNRGYFAKSPDKIRRSYKKIGAFLFLFGISALIAMFTVSSMVFVDYDLVLPVCFPFIMIFPGIGMFLVSSFMPAKTDKGTKIYEKIQGFRMFLHTADRYRLEKESPKFVKELNPKTFEKYLPYAMVLGVEKEWAKVFKDIYTAPPEWFEGNFDTFNTIYLIDSLSRLNRATVHAMSAVRSSSGSSSGWSVGSGWSGGGGFSGGFSGGGGGGGSIGAR